MNWTHQKSIYRGTAFAVNAACLQDIPSTCHMNKEAEIFNAITMEYVSKSSRELVTEFMIVSMENSEYSNPSISHDWFSKPNSSLSDLIWSPKRKWKRGPSELSGQNLQFLPAKNWDYKLVLSLFTIGIRLECEHERINLHHDLSLLEIQKAGNIALKGWTSLPR